MNEEVDNSVMVVLNGNPSYTLTASNLGTYEECSTFFNAVLQLLGMSGLKVKSCDCGE